MQSTTSSSSLLLPGLLCGLLDHFFGLRTSEHSSRSQGALTLLLGRRTESLLSLARSLGKNMDKWNAELLLACCGCAISTAFFISASETIARITTNQPIEQFSVDPYLAALLNFGFMIIYGVVLPNSVVACVNIIGLLAYAVYVIVFVWYGDINAKKKIAYCVCAELAFFTAYSLVFMLAVHDPNSRRLAFGVISAVFNIAMYGFPLATLRKIMNTGSSASMSFWLSLATVLNCAVWLGYSAINDNIYQMVSNAVGMVLGMLQVFIYCYYMHGVNPAIPEAVVIP